MTIIKQQKMNIKCKENYAIIMIINVSNLFFIRKNLVFF